MRLVPMLAVALAAGLTVPASTRAADAPAPPPFEVGQVWTYIHRPADTDSLLRIAAIEDGDDGKIYHVSVTGLKFACDAKLTDISHLPVAEQTLRQSVLATVASDAPFPDAAEGIATWRADHGGVFGISIAEIADVVEQSVCAAKAPPADAK